MLLFELSATECEIYAKWGHFHERSKFKTIIYNGIFPMCHSISKLFFALKRGNPNWKIVQHACM